MDDAALYPDDTVVSGSDIHEKSREINGLWNMMAQGENSDRDSIDGDYHHGFLILDGEDDEVNGPTQPVSSKDFHASGSALSESYYSATSDGKNSILGEASLRAGSVGNLAKVAEKISSTIKKVSSMPSRVVSPGSPFKKNMIRAS